jgi:hypothetical protein
MEQSLCDECVKAVLTRRINVVMQRQGQTGYINPQCPRHQKPRISCRAVNVRGLQGTNAEG